MPRHYLKISRWLKSYAAQHAPLDEDWRTTIFNDLTHGSQELHLVPLPANEQGPLVGLCGETFFCHAGIDRHEPSSLFISRILAAKQRPLHLEPKVLDAELALLSEDDRSPLPRDPVRPIFDLMSTPLVTPAATPSAPLLRALAAAPAELAARWNTPLPATHSGEAGRGDDLLAALGPLWRTYRLERYLEIKPRYHAFLSGTIKPRQLSEADCHELAVVFGVNTLNALAANTEAEPSLLLALLADLASVPLDERQRSAVAAALGAAHLRYPSEAPASLLPPAPLPAPEPERDIDTTQAWILRRAGLEMADLERRARAVDDAVAAWRSESASPDPVTGAVALAEKLVRLEHAVAAGTRGLPDPASISERRQAAGRALTRAERVLANPQRLLALAPELGVEELSEIAELVSHPGSLAALPPWLWSGAERGLAAAPGRDLTSSDSQRVAAWAEELLDGNRRALVAQAVLELEALEPSLRPLLAATPLPPADMAPRMHLARAAENLRALAGTLSALADEHVTWAHAAVDAGWPRERMLNIAHALEELRSRLSPAVFGELVHDFAHSIAASGPSKSATSADTARLRVRRYQVAITQIEELLGDAHDASFAQIARALERVDSAGGEALRPPVRAAETRRPDAGVPRLSFEHNWVDESGRRAPLTLVPHDDRERPYGVASVPLVMTAARPAAVACELEIKIESSLHTGWPAGWERPGPRHLIIDRNDWRAEGDEYRYTFELTIPLRRPKTGKESVEVLLRAVDQGSNKLLGEPKRLRWDGLATWSGEIPFAWADTVRPEYVAKHPIGPQERYEDIVTRLATGGSFAVLAPRRFGKTTLVEHMHKHAAESGLAVPPPVVCTSVMGEHGINWTELWQRVSDGLEGVLGVGLVAPGTSLPAEDAFEAARRAALDQGKQAIAVLFDEAQLMFSHDSGTRLGDVLKDRLERCWSRTDIPGQVPLVFGFIGLPGLRERAGANLMGILRPYEGRHLDERALNRLILQVTEGRLSTTREARRELTMHAGNLYILKTLLDRLLGQVNRRRRPWASFDDVRAAVEELRAELERSIEPTVAQYLRDPFNEAEDINVWQPRPSYPVAVALAAQPPELSPRARVAAAGQLLAEWCAQAGIAGVAGELLRDRNAEHVAVLCDLGLWNDDGFTSMIVAAWLRGMARGFPAGAGDREVLARAVSGRLHTAPASDGAPAGGAGDGAAAPATRTTTPMVSTAGTARMLVPGPEAAAVSQGHDHWQALAGAAGGDLDKRWFHDVVVAYRPSLLAVMNGAQVSALARGTELARFFDHLLAAYPDAAETLDLNAVAPANPYAGERLAHPAIRLLQALRASSGDGAHAPRAVQDLAGDDDAMHRLLIEGAVLVAAKIELPSLPAIARLILGSPAAEAA